MFLELEVLRQYATGDRAGAPPLSLIADAVHEIERLNREIKELKEVDQWSRSALSALDAAKEKLGEDGCDCGANDPPCALCVVQRAIKTFPNQLMSAGGLMPFPATQIIHMLSGPVPACDTHASQLRGLAAFLGCHAAATEAPEGSICTNCENAAKAKATA